MYLENDKITGMEDTMLARNATAVVTPEEATSNVLIQSVHARAYMTIVGL